MSKKYIGITIGPIAKTLMLTTTPAGLWGASYIFSYLARRLVETLEKDLKINKESFLVPVRGDEVEKIIEECPWAGLFHDRIIYEVRDNGGDLAKVQQCVENVKKELARKLADNLSENREEVQKYIENYVQVHVVCQEILGGKNPILELGQSLDVLELQQAYNPKESTNYILKFLENRRDLQSSRTEDRNERIKDSFLLKENEGKEKVLWHFLKEGNRNIIITIDEIVGIYQNTSRANTQPKKYYALIKTDGDNLGKVLRDMKGENINRGIQEFSLACFEYAKESFVRVEAYGGKMIYAGGDDLLFIAPVTGEVDKDNMTVFHLLDKLKDDFNKRFEDFHFVDDKDKQIKPMGFSAGVMICYYKYPLCEALAGVLKQLDSSKIVDGKNTITVHFEKHSGKQRAVQFKDFTKHGVYRNFLELLLQYKKGGKRAEITNDFLRSVGKKLEQYQSVFSLAMARSELREGECTLLRQTMSNLFEEYPGVFNEEKENNKSIEAKYIEKITELLEEIFVSRTNSYNDKRPKSEGEDPKKEDEIKEKIVLPSIQEVQAIIGLLSFYNEKEIK